MNTRMTDPMAIDLEEFAIKHAGVGLFPSEVDSMFAEIETLRKRMTKFNDWLSQHESNLAKSRRETDDARRELKFARGLSDECE